ncbi:hypothetical protein WMF37_38175 [Sorangium sp. So ce291]|uniref:hypothetical protein n=1 Tax=Sorangium sp. So ce291 TaxID=3133294 RepID=UPI003F5F2755
MVTLLQAHVGASDVEAVELSVVDLRWQRVLGCLRAAMPPFSQGALHAFRERMVAGPGAAPGGGARRRLHRPRVAREGGVGDAARSADTGPLAHRRGRTGSTARASGLSPAGCGLCGRADRRGGDAAAAQGVMPSGSGPR